MKECLFLSDICLVLLGHNHNLLVEYMVVLDFSLSLLHQVFEAKFLVLKGKCHLALDFYMGFLLVD
jgi:hypothetical protein